MRKGTCKYRECGKEFLTVSYNPTYCCAEHGLLEKKLHESEVAVISEMGATARRRAGWRKASAKKRRDDARGALAYKNMMNSK